LRDGWMYDETEILRQYAGSIVYAKYGFDSLTVKYARVSTGLVSKVTVICIAPRSGWWGVEDPRLAGRDQGWQSIPYVYPRGGGPVVPPDPWPSGLPDELQVLGIEDLIPLLDDTKGDA